MRKAEQMYQYCLDKGFGEGFNRRWGLKHFKVIENNLHENENVYLTFIGLKDFVSTSEHDGNYAYALTDKRIIYGQKKLFGENLGSITLKHFNDIHHSTGMIFGKITIDTLGEVFNVGVDKESASKLSTAIHRFIFNNKNKKENDGLASILSEFKELYDNNLITKEEYEKKRKKLLKL